MKIEKRERVEICRKFPQKATVMDMNEQKEKIFFGKNLEKARIKEFAQGKHDTPVNK